MRLLPFIALLLLVQACQKDKAKPTPPEVNTPSDYFFPMKTGNYWIYKVSTERAVYPNSNIVVTYDTLRIVDDTVINNITYYQFKTSGWQMIHTGSLLGDSSGFIKYSEGIKFPLSNVANDTLYIDSSQMPHFLSVIRTGNLDSVINVPAGSYHALESVLDFYYLAGPPPHPNLTNPRPILNYFTKDIGLVKCITWFSSGSGTIVSELQSYHIQP